VWQAIAAVRLLIVLLSLAFPLGLMMSEPSVVFGRYHEIRAMVTGYNTVPAQTDKTPCIAASGKNICGRRDAVACPRDIELGTVVEIRGATYTCEDRTARKFNDRFDISCDKDKACPYQVAGWTNVRVYEQ
jgi:hypothetical protein